MAVHKLISKSRCCTRFRASLQYNDEMGNSNEVPIARGVWSDRARISNGCLSGDCDSRNDDPRIRANDDFKRRRARIGSNWVATSFVVNNINEP